MQLFCNFFSFFCEFCIFYVHRRRECSGQRVPECVSGILTKNPRGSHESLDQSGYRAETCTCELLVLRDRSGALRFATLIPPTGFIFYIISVH